jgi:hypothetical protein
MTAQLIELPAPPALQWLTECSVSGVLAVLISSDWISEFLHAQLMSEGAKASTYLEVSPRRWGLPSL